MSIIEAIILGIIQGLTEFLPVSSSGHLELGKQILGVNTTNNLLFSLILHLATVCSTILVFRKDIYNLFVDIFIKRESEAIKFLFQIIVSMLPILVVGLFFKDEVESFFDNNITLVGCMLLVTAILLLISERGNWKDGKLNSLKAFGIGLAQAVAVLPGISRSGSTIATALIFGVEKSKAARFSFLMVIPPIVGASLLDFMDLTAQEAAQINYVVMIIGFLTAFATGAIACNWMMKIVKNGKLSYFAFYCIIVGLIAIFTNAI